MVCVISLIGFYNFSVKNSKMIWRHRNYVMLINCGSCYLRNTGFFQKLFHRNKSNTLTEINIHSVWSNYPKEYTSGGKLYLGIIQHETFQGILFFRTSYFCFTYFSFAVSFLSTSLNFLCEKGINPLLSSTMHYLQIKKENTLKFCVVGTFLNLPTYKQHNIKRSIISITCFYLFTICFYKFTSSF